MSSEMQLATLSVLGTLAGTLLGWVLNNLSRLGKLNFFVTSWEEHITFNQMGVMTSSRSKEESENLQYVLKIDIHNSSMTPMILREVNVVFADKNKAVWESVPSDVSTRRFGGGSYRYDNLLVVNMPAKTVEAFELTGHANLKDPQLQELWNATNVFFRYKDQKNKLRKVKINLVEYNDYFT